MLSGLHGGAARYLCRAALLGGGVGDGQLLERFLACRDEAAFELLVRRHGPRVLGVCRQVLGQEADAEDAFQATFLVLVRRAAAVVPREAVGAWLAGVARRTARKAKLAAARRRSRERLWFARNPPPADRCPADDRAGLLLREVERLPEVYRAAVALCDLEGLSRREAARRLGWPEGTLSGRLARARQLLARRLLRQGLPVWAGALAVPAGLVGSTVRAAALVAAGNPTAGAVSPPVASLTEGVIRSMRLNKLTMALVALVAAALFGVGVGSFRPGGGDATAAPPAAAPKPPASDHDRIQGAWTVAELTQDGRPILLREERAFVFRGDQFLIPIYTEVVGPSTISVPFQLGSASAPKQIDLTPPAQSENKGKVLPGVYAFDGDQLTLCFAAAGGRRPTELAAPAGSGRTLLVLRRGETKLQVYWSDEAKDLKVIDFDGDGKLDLFVANEGRIYFDRSSSIGLRKSADDVAAEAKRKQEATLRAYERMMNFERLMKQASAANEKEILERLVKDLNQQVAILQLEAAVQKLKSAGDGPGRKQALQEVEKAVKTAKQFID